MATVSVAIATYNEADNIGKCLESVVSLADEIVLVDGGSEDTTIEIAKKYKARIIRTNNPSIFHINKQKAIDASKKDWILQLDADEFVTPELRKEISEVIDLNNGIDGYWVPRKNYFLGSFLSKGGQYPDFTLRLYRNGKGRLPCKSVHEQAVVNGKTGYLKNHLLHYPYPDFAHYLEHFNRYTDIFAEELADEKLPTGLRSTANQLFVKPLSWFFFTFFRHKGFYDGLSGFVFSFFSALRFPVSYLKYREKILHKK